MSEKKYTIILSDGTTIQNLTKNGSNFVSKTDISSSMFEGTCAPVTVREECSDDENAGSNEFTYESMELVQITKMDSEYWFVLRERSANEIAFSKMQSDVAFVAMMSNVDL